jgi:hypothetical protein
MAISRQPTPLDRHGLIKFQVGFAAVRPVNRFTDPQPLAFQTSTKAAKQQSSKAAKQQSAILLDLAQLLLLVFAQNGALSFAQATKAENRHRTR